MAGNDRIFVQNLIRSGVSGGTGNDSITVGNSVDSIIDGGGGDDQITVLAATRTTGQTDNTTASGAASQVRYRDGLGNSLELNEDDLVAVGPGGAARVVSQAE